MAFTDLSHLPRAEQSVPEGLAPDAEPRFIGVLVDQWAESHDEHKATAKGTKVRHSDAGKCSRAIAYTAAGIPKSDPMDLTGVWNVHLGQMLHEQWQAALQRAYPGAEVEVVLGDAATSGHADAVIRTDDKVILYELKTIGGYGFKNAVGKARRGQAAEGPKTEHILQASLNGFAIEADEIVIGYLAKEAISVNVGRGMTDLARFAAEWTFTQEQYLPLAQEERGRLIGILELLEEHGEMASRKIPGGEIPAKAEIVDPSKGRWEEVDGEGMILDTGSYWGCGYCAYRTLCVKTEAGRIPLESVVKIGDAA